MNRTIEWLYEQLGKLHAEKMILQEELAKLQVEVAALKTPPAPQPAS